MNVKENFEQDVWNNLEFNDGRGCNTHGGLSLYKNVWWELRRNLYDVICHNIANNIEDNTTPTTPISSPPRRVIVQQIRKQL